MISTLYSLLPSQRRAHRRALDSVLSLQCAGDLEGALEAWRSILARFPRSALTYGNLIACSRELRRLEECDGYVKDGLRFFPKSREIKAEAAQFEERRGNWDIATGHWAAVVQQPECHVVWRQCYVHNLLICGRPDEADKLLQVWRPMYPDHSGLLAVEAMLATSRNELDKALTLWDAFRRRFPDDVVGWEHYGRAYQAKQMSTLDGAVSREEDVPEHIERQEDDAKRTLLLGFESLGHDCEFGLVQRRFGAEPLGLLRFNSVAYGDLVTALANRFARMGEPDVTELVTMGNGEYFIRDRRWGLGMHTFVFEHQETAEELYPKFCRRVAFLRDKFLADVAEGRKIFVYVSPAISEEDLRMLHRAFRVFGPVTLLHVVQGETGGAGIGHAEPGTVRDLGDGLIVAYLSRPGRNALRQWNIAFDEWVDVCERARQMVAQAALVDPAAVEIVERTA